MTEKTEGLVDRFKQIAERLKSSHLFLVVASLFVLDLLIPDPIWFIDEIILFIITVLIARWQLGRTEPPAPPKPPPKNVTPPAQ